jgi:hypothetical protein
MISQAKVRMHIIHLKLKIIILEWMNFQDNQSVCQNQHKTHIKLKTLLEWMTFSRQTNAAKETIHRTQLIPHGQRGTGYIQYFQ